MNVHDLSIEQQNELERIIMDVQRLYFEYVQDNLECLDKQGKPITIWIGFDPKGGDSPHLVNCKRRGN